MTGSPVVDPLRFDNEQDDLEEEVPLHNDPPSPPAGPLGAHANPPPAAQPQEPASDSGRPSEQYAAAVNGRTDPLSMPAPAAAGLPPVPTTASSSYASSYGGHARTPSYDAPPSHRRDPSLTLDQVDTGADDSSWMRGAAAAAGAASGAGAGPSSSASGAASARAAAAAAAATITVSDPVRHVGDSMIPGIQSAHYEYLVASSLPSGGGEGASSSSGSTGGRRKVEVRRRFKDFVALADLLSVTHRGYFVFPRPDKNTLDQQLGKSDFVEVRRHELERYLRKLATHPVVGHSEELRIFLQAKGQLSASYEWQQLQPLRGSLLEGVARLPRQLIGSDSSVPSASEAAQNARNTSDLLRRFKELGERMKQEYRTPPLLAGDETKLREEKAGIEEYQEKLALASRKAERVVREFEEMGAVLGDLGLSLLKLARYEDEEGSKLGPYSELGSGARLVATEARRTGMAAVKLSRLSRLATAQQVEALAPLHDELALAPAAVAALREREAALLTVQSIEEDMEKRRRALGQLEEAGSRTIGGAKTRKVEALQNELAAAEHAAEAARREYARVKGRNEEELARWRAEKQEGFRQMAAGYAQVNSLYEERGSQHWRAVAEGDGEEEQGLRPGSSSGGSRR